MSTDHFQPDLASNAASFTSASPTFTPDGLRLAWAENDGVHFANTSDLGSCSAVTDGLLVAGAAYPFFGKADMSATAGVSQTGTQGVKAHKKLTARSRSRWWRPTGTWEASSCATGPISSRIFSMSRTAVSPSPTRA